MSPLIPVIDPLLVVVTINVSFGEIVGFNVKLFPLAADIVPLLVNFDPAKRKISST